MLNDQVWVNPFFNLRMVAVTFQEFEAQESLRGYEHNKYSFD